jgi:type IV fimbrial biogenesis protein FimT
MLMHSRRSRDRSRGFTLIELLVVLAIVGISMTLAAPSFSQMIANYRVRGAAESVLNGLSYARTEALRRNSPVRFSLDAGVGWTVSQVSPSTTLQARASSDGSGTTVASGSANTAVTFLPTGLVQAGAQLAQVTVSSGVAGTGTRQINIYGGGLIRMCDPGVSTANDPRRC